MNRLRLKSERPIGLLGKAPASEGIQHCRFAPQKMNADLVEHYWWVCWRLTEDQVLKRSVLSHPTIHVCMEQGKSWLYGVQQKVFSRQLRGCSQVVGIKFKPGGFYPFYRQSLHQLNDQRVPVDALLSETMAKLIQSFSQRFKHTCEQQHIAAMLSELDQALAAICPPVDAETRLCGELIRHIQQQPLSIKVQQLSESLQISTRQLQRLCRQRIGMSPKALLNRYRMQQVARQLANADSSWKDFIIPLGYTDQAHFINDFKKHIGQPPGAYVRSLQR